MKTKIIIKTAINRFFGILFLTIAILNAIFIDRVPGVLYTLFSLIYFPPIQKITDKILRFSIPFILKTLLALVILRGTLGVGDLMELFESYMRTK